MDGFERRRQRKKESILNAAMELFDIHGYTKAGIAEVAKKAGVSQASIYNFFGSKENLKIELYRTIAEREFTRTADILNRDGDVKEKLRDLLKSKIEFLQMFSVGTFLTDYQNFIDVATKSLPDNVRNNTWESIRTLFDEGKKQGYFVDTVSTDAMISLIEMLIFNLKFNNEKYIEAINKDVLLEDMLYLVFNGIIRKDGLSSCMGVGATATYLGSSAWSLTVEKSSVQMIFDYFEDGTLTKQQDLWLKNAKDNVLFFFSHKSANCFGTEFYVVTKKHSQVYNILGNFGHADVNTLVMVPHEKRELLGVKIYSCRSTGKGVCFLVCLNGVNIFHSGDNANWENIESLASYYDEIDYIENLHIKVDIVFIPVCTNSGQHSQSIFQSALYTIQRLKPAVIFPIHTDQVNDSYEDFQDVFTRSGLKGRLICPEGKEQEFIV